MRTKLLPSEQWYTIRPDQGFAEMVDPSGMPYRPDRPPIFIHEDPILGPALEVTAQEACNMRVTVLCGEQQEAADLGAAGAFEALIDDAQLFGDDTRGFRSPLSDGYTTRMLNVTDQAKLAGKLQVFNVVDSGADSETKDYALDLQDQSNAAVADIAQEEPSGLADLEMYIKFDVATAHVTNAFGWLMVASACRRLRDNLPGDAPAEQHLVLSVNTFQTDIARKFGALGIASRLITPGRERWSEDTTESESFMRALLASGKLALR